jgi:hypothetical protein
VCHDEQPLFLEQRQDLAVQFHSFEVATALNSPTGSLCVKVCCSDGSPRNVLSDATKPLSCFVSVFEVRRGDEDDALDILQTGTIRFGSLANVQGLLYQSQGGIFTKIGSKTYLLDDKARQCVADEDNAASMDDLD